MSPDVLNSHTHSAAVFARNICRTSRLPGYSWEKGKNPPLFILRRMKVSKNESFIINL